MVVQLEALASRRKTTRSQVIRELLEKALKRSK
jgi:metal-responsive CopG/Arc/MetJ family transcriptional regulator